MLARLDLGWTFEDVRAQLEDSPFVDGELLKSVIGRISALRGHENPPGARKEEAACTR